MFSNSNGQLLLVKIKNKKQIWIPFPSFVAHSLRPAPSAHSVHLAPHGTLREPHGQFSQVHFLNNFNRFRFKYFDERFYVFESEFCCLNCVKIACTSRNSRIVSTKPQTSPPSRCTFTRSSSWIKNLTSNFAWKTSCRVTKCFKHDFSVFVT